MSMGANELESGKYLHNKITKPYYQPSETPLMLTYDGGSQKENEIVVNKSVTSLKSFGMIESFSMGDVFTDKEE